MKPLLLASLFFGSVAFAAKPVVTSVTGVSNVKVRGSVTAFGGFGGAACVSPDLNSTCDSCVAGGLVACNPTRAYNALLFRVAATHVEQGNLILVRTADGTLVSSSPHNPNEVSVPWSAVCAGLGAGAVADCEVTPVKEGTLGVCLDKNLNNLFDAGEECQDISVKVSQMPAGTHDISTADDGITDFLAFPGNEKTYLEDFLTSANFPNLSHGGKIASVRVFSSVQGMTSAAPGLSSATRDLVLVNDVVLADNILDGLTNGVEHWLRLGLVDEANNVGFFWPPASFVDSNGKNCDVEACAYSVIPSEVVGK